ASTTTPESLTTTTLPEPEESVRELVSVLDGDTPFEEVLATANELTEPGSPAHGYALYQAAQSQAIVLSGSPGVSASQRVTPDGGIESCQEVNGERQCATFDDFVATSSGRIVEFSVNGQSIAGRVAVQLGDSAS